MMPLSKQQLLTIWESGRKQHPVDQALTILGFASPDQTRGELAELNIGKRDYQLLNLRERLFGEKFQCTGTCPDCDKPVDISFTTQEIQTQTSVAETKETVLSLENRQIFFRLPNSWDLAAIVRSENEECARKTLIERCVLKILQDEQSIAVKELSEEAIQMIEEAITECDPHAEILLELNCPECGTKWQEMFDIADFLWTEIAASAKRLFQEVHMLASVYGWSEAEILALNDARRQTYLEMVNA